jgi:hypothetical protein
MYIEGRRLLLQDQKNIRPMAVIIYASICSIYGFFYWILEFLYIFKLKTVPDGAKIALLASGRRQALVRTFTAGWRT